MILLAAACVLIFSLQFTIASSRDFKRTLMNISDDKLTIRPETFILNHEVRYDGENPRRYLYTRPSQRHLNIKIIDMMRQQIYAAQDRMRRLAPVLAKYKEDIAFRMAYIYNRLDQLIIDIRRIYTQALRWKIRWKQVPDHIIWYTHIVRKYMDVLYIVEHVIDLHTANMDQLGIM